MGSRIQRLKESSITGDLGYVDVGNAGKYEKIITNKKNLLVHGNPDGIV
jgi:hypothetical protein